ncbi:ERF family protein, partial [Frateuria sp.]|uniref:ERF family protein n=1 Tax=Frateuria sp. TaxID=2211372 RepID=UPI003F802A73
SKYATYGKLDKALRPVYTDHGFALSFDTGPDAPADCVRVLCYVSHRNGHSRTYHVDMPSDGKGAKGGDVMTKTHAVGAGMSYGMRYLLKMIFNVAVGEDDDDGNYGASDPLADWLQAVEACTDDKELAGRKREMVDAFGGVNKVPAKLRTACTAKAESLKAGQ